MSVPARIREYWNAMRVHLAGKWLYVCAAIVLVLFIPVYIFFIPAAGFPRGKVITIPADSTSEQIAAQLASEHVIRDAFEFNIYTRLTGQSRMLQSGIYVFSNPLGMGFVANRIAQGEHGVNEARITLTEGMTAKDMAQAVALQIPGFETNAFLGAASTSEGYLFPDTYFILPGTQPADIVQRLRNNFDTKIASIQPQITKFGKPLRDDVIIASILEREAKLPADKRIIAGILYNRIKAGMPLQVDAAFGYIHGEDGYTPTQADLASDSPYNTYKFAGLPPTPISNPGLDSLLAAVTPTKTSYLYYITGTDGTMHYATTFAQHKANIAKYLK